MAAEDEQRQWRISVHAKSSIVNLSIKATGTPPPAAAAAAKPHRLTAMLRLRGFFVKMKSSSAPTNLRRGGIFKSTFRRIFQRSAAPLPPTQEKASTATARPNPLSRLEQLVREDPVGIGSVFLAVFVLGAISALSLKSAIAAASGVTVSTISLILSSSSLLLLLEKFMRGRNKNHLRLIFSNLLVILIVFVASVFCDLGKHFVIFKNYVLRYISGRL